MRTYTAAAVSAAAVVGALLSTTPAAADEPPTGAKNVPLTVLVLTSAHAGINPASSPDRAALLGCHPTWAAGHHQPKQACATLTSVAGDFKRLNVNPDAMCPKIYRPVKVTAQGWWKEKKVSYEKTFTNSCELQAATGAVFDF
ncbi:SSI family serine proteinase inhibitor [Streptomyces sp. L2]|uniref:SSI family serine proteinase inhibitor n=1 Tax=Streptomyces sp. L2 TaxID=2162665 RepID=UPI00101032B4|nr:SSI family serine proteinase inhibitor [Streptomyces sp. L2]